MSATLTRPLWRPQERGKFEAKRWNNITARFERIFVRIKHLRRTLCTQLRANFRCFRKISERDYQLCHACPSALPSTRPSLCPHGTSRFSLDGFSLHFLFEYFSKKLPRKFTLHLNLTTITGTVHGDRYTFLTIYHSVLLRMRNISAKILQKIKTFSTFGNFPFLHPPPPKIVPFMRQCGSYCINRQATDEYVEHTYCMLDT